MTHSMARNFDLENINPGEIGTTSESSELSKSSYGLLFHSDLIKPVSPP